MDFFKVLALGVILPAAIFFGVVSLRDRPVEQELKLSEMSGGFVGLPSANGSPTLELVAFLFSHSRCHGAQLPGFSEVIRDLGPSLRSEAVRAGIAFRTVGVSVDWNPRDGWEHFSRLGAFDELILGGNWLNTATEKIIWQGLAPASVPQLVILNRNVEWTTAGPIVSNETVIERLVGAERIMEWYETMKKTGNLEIFIQSIDDDDSTS